MVSTVFRGGVVCYSLLSLVAEETAVFGRMIFRQGELRVFTVAVDTEFLRLFFIHGHKAFMIGVMRQVRRGFRRRVPEKQEQADTENEKKPIINQYFFSAVHFYPLPYSEKNQRNDRYGTT